MARISTNPKLVAIFIICLFVKSHGAQQQVPCLFFFGASLTDNGNNNMLNTVLKSNYPPYGIDFFAGPTGRFSNGRNTPDFIAQLLGFNNSIPPFATATGSAIAKGVNYASAGAGILDDTSRSLGDRISLNRQLLNHQTTISGLSPILGQSTQVQDYLNKCLYIVEMGSNDYVNNYIQPQNYPETASLTPNQFAALLIQQYTTQLKALYTSGARKVVIYGVPPLGCIPQVRAMFPANTSGCVDYVNKYTRLFNRRLKHLVDNLNANLRGAKFIYINMSGILISILASIAELLGFDKPIPAFATAVGSAILKGVNYASAAAGILDETGIIVGDRISLNRQLLNHKATIASLSLLLGPARLKDYLNKCLYAVNMGSNDYLNNYLLPQFYPSSKLYTPDQFSAFLIHQYSQQLKTLYDDGARKVAVFGLGPIGCVPPLLAMYPVNVSGCVDFINDYVKLFNDRLKPLVEDLNTNLPAAKFTYINLTSISLGIFSLPGITVSNYSCCVVGIALCEPYQVPCSRRNQYIFFDDYHPTEFVNQYTAARIYNALLPSDAHPFDIHQLAQQ